MEHSNAIWPIALLLAFLLGLILGVLRGSGKLHKLRSAVIELCFASGSVEAQPAANGSNNLSDPFSALGAIATKMDRMEQVSSDAALAEQKYRNMVVNAPVCIHEIDTSGRLKSMNPAGLQMMGHSKFEPLQGIDYMSIPTEADRKKVSMLFDNAISGKAAEFEFCVETENHVATFLSRFAPVFGSDEQVTEVVGMTIDVTEQRRLEELERQAHRIEAIGNLTGGMAHDFNNLLAVILGNLELAVLDLEDEDLVELVQSSIDAALRGAELTRSMLAFARKAPLQPKVVDLNDTVRSAKNWIARTIPANVEIEISLLAGLWKSEIDEPSATSTLLNLFVNARDAMPDGGKITVETSNIRVDGDYIHNRGEDIEPGRYVLVAVTDTGTGIRPNVMERIFEPFYSTKGPGNGSGLGLAMIMGFLKQSGGTVRVYSEVDIGTTFKLYFPATHENGSVEKPSKTNQTKTLVGKKKILIAEDEPGVRASLVKIMTRAGHSVQAAETGDEAAEIFAADGGFDLLLTDIVMPGSLQGTGLAKKIRELSPDFPVVFMTGYASEATVHGNGLHPDDIRLMKPVRHSDLLAAIEQSLV